MFAVYVQVLFSKLKFKQRLHTTTISKHELRNGGTFFGHISHSKLPYCRYNYIILYHKLFLIFQPILRKYDAVTAEICELTVSDDELPSKSGGDQMSHV